MEPDNEDQGDGMDNSNGNLGDGGIDAEGTDGVCPPVSAAEKRIWYRQESFLAAYPAAGNILAAAMAIGMSDRQVRRWVESDVLGFRARLDLAQRRQREHLEHMMFRALEDAQPKDLLNHPILPIFALKGAWRAKYGDLAVPVADETVKNILAELKRIARERRSPGGSMGPPLVVDEAEEILRRKQGQG